MHDIFHIHKRSHTHTNIYIHKKNVYKLIIAYKECYMDNLMIKNSEKKIKFIIFVNSIFIFFISMAPIW